MKKMGKNTKLYLIGMIIGGITLGITTVIADTIINSTSVAYKTTTVKAAIDELYGLADLKPRVETLEGYFQNNPTAYFNRNRLQLNASEDTPGSLELYSPTARYGMIRKSSSSNGIVIDTVYDGNYSDITLKGSPVYIGNDMVNVNEIFSRYNNCKKNITVPANGAANSSYNVEIEGKKVLLSNCGVYNNDGAIAPPGVYLTGDWISGTADQHYEVRSWASSSVTVEVCCDILYQRLI